MEYVRVPVSGGRTMHVTIFGPTDGQPAVALHGLGGSTEQNLPALEAVATYYGLRIHAIDLPNHCRSGKVGILHFQVRHFADLTTMGFVAEQRHSRHSRPPDEPRHLPCHPRTQPQ